MPVGICMVLDIISDKGCLFLIIFFLFSTCFFSNSVADSFSTAFNEINTSAIPILFCSIMSKPKSSIRNICFKCFYFLIVIVSQCIALVRVGMDAWVNWAHQEMNAFKHTQYRLFYERIYASIMRLSFI